MRSPNVVHARANRPRASGGFGLVELMVAMIIGLVLIAGAAEIFIGSKRTYMTSNELSRLQENARYAAHVLTQDLRMAGYSGCSPKVRNMLDTSSPSYSPTLWDISRAVSGWEYTGTGYDDEYTITSLDPDNVALNKWNNGEAANSSLAAELEDRVVPGTDVIAIKKLSARQDIKLKDNNVINSTSLNVEQPNNLKKDQILLVTKDCINADLFQNRSNDGAAAASAGKGAGKTPGNAENKFSAVYNSESYFLTFETAVYFVGINPKGEPALYRAPFDGTGLTTAKLEELASGVESLQVVYGEDTDATPDGVANRYVSIDQVTDGERIVDVRFSLLMRTEGEPLERVDADSTYLLAGKTTIIPQADRRLRYVLTSTVKLRNRGI